MDPDEWKEKKNQEALDVLYSILATLERIEKLLGAKWPSEQKDYRFPLTIETKTFKCPQCEAKMVSRTNRKTGEPFYGCSRYPECNATRDANGKENTRPQSGKVSVASVEEKEPPF